MRPVIVLSAVVFAFAAGWLLRGCADDRVMPVEVNPPAPRSSVVARPPVRRERTTSRGPTGPEAGTPGTDSGSSSHGKATDGESTRPSIEPEAPNPETPKPGDAKPLHDVTGVVVDNITRAPIAGVRIHFCATCDGEGLGWEGDTTDAQGRFHDHVMPDWPVEKCRFEVVAGRDGYRSARVPVVTAEVRVELEKLDRTPRPGRVVGTARGEDDKPISGRLFVGMNDELDLHSFGVWTNADANGRFAIDGIAPGHWTVALSESRESFEVNVSEDGEASVDLRGKFEGATGAFATGEMTEAEFAREKTRLELLESSAMRSKDEFAAGAAGYAKQQLELQWLRHSPGRDVVVTGLPSTTGAYVRLERREGACCEWHGAIAGGTASFASVPFSKWRAVLVRPGETDICVDVDVKAGDGALSVELAAAK